MKRRFVIACTIILGVLIASLIGGVSVLDDRVYTVAEASEGDSADGEGETDYC